MCSQNVAIYNTAQNLSHDLTRQSCSKAYDHDKHCLHEAFVTLSLSV